MAQSTRRNKIERQSAKVPSGLFIAAALGSVVGSAYLKSKGKDDESLFVGQWAPTFIALGIYNKFIQVLEHD